MLNIQPYYLFEAKEAIINRMNWPEEDKKKIQELVNKYPQKASKIDWNNIAELSVSNIIEQLQQESKKQVKKQIRTGVAGLTEGKDYIVLGASKDQKIYAPLNHKASATIGRGARWCISMENNDTHWNSYTEDGIKFAIVITNTIPTFDKIAIAIMGREDGSIYKTEGWDSYNQRISNFTLEKEVKINYDILHKWYSQIHYKTIDSFIMAENLVELKKALDGKGKGFERGTNPLHKAAMKAIENSKLSVVKFLLDYPEMDVSAYSNQAIRKAISKGNFEIFNLLINHPTFDLMVGTQGYNPIIYLIDYKRSKGSQKFLDALLKHPAIQNLKSSDIAYILREAFAYMNDTNKSVNLVKQLFSIPSFDLSNPNYKEIFESSLRNSIILDYILVTKLLFDFGPKVNPKDYLRYATTTPLKHLLNTYKPQRHQDV